MNKRQFIYDCLIFTIFVIAILAFVTTAGADTFFSTTTETGDRSTTTVMTDDGMYFIYRQEVGGLSTATVFGPDSHGSASSYDYGEGPTSYGYGWSEGDDDTTDTILMLETQRMDRDDEEVDDLHIHTFNCDHD